MSTVARAAGCTTVRAEPMLTSAQALVPARAHDVVHAIDGSAAAPRTIRLPGAGPPPRGRTRLARVLRVGHSCYSSQPARPFGPARFFDLTLESFRTMARMCAICGKTSMGGFNPQSVGMNRVRAHRRMTANLQPMRLRGWQDDAHARVHALPSHDAEDRLALRGRALRSSARRESSQIVIGPSLTSSTCHLRPEDALGDLHPSPFHGRAEPLVELAAQLRRRRVDERRPPAFARIREQRELADGQHLAADVHQRPIGLALLIAEDAQVDRLVGQRPAVATASSWPTPTRITSPAPMLPTTFASTDTCASSRAEGAGAP